MIPHPYFDARVHGYAAVLAPSTLPRLHVVESGATVAATTNVAAGRTTGVQEVAAFTGWLTGTAFIIAALVGAYLFLLRWSQRPRAPRAFRRVMQACELLIDRCDDELGKTGAGLALVVGLFARRAMQIGAMLPATAVRELRRFRRLLTRAHFALTIERRREMVGTIRSAVRTWWTSSWTWRLRMTRTAALCAWSVVCRAVILVARPMISLYDTTWNRRARWAATTLRFAAVWSAIVAVTVPAVPMRAVAADYYWDADATAAGNDAATGAGLGSNGTWNLSLLNWWDLANDVAWVNGVDRAVFWGSAGTVTLGEPITVGGLSFKTTGYTVTGDTLTLSGASPMLGADLGVSATIGSLLAGTSGLTTSGGGTIRLTNNANSYTGTTTISNGSLIISNMAQLGADGSAVVVTGFNPTVGSTSLRGFGGGSLVLDGSAAPINFTRNLSLQGQGPIADRGAALISTGNNTLSGTVDTGVAYSGTNLSTRIIAADGSLNLTGTLNINGTAGTTINTLGAVNQAGASFYNLTGVLAGAGTLESSGGGTLFLNPSDSSGFSGVIRVSGSAASGQSVVRIDSPGVLGTRTSGTTSAVLDLNGGVLAVLMDSPDVKVSNGSNANVYFRASSTIFADHTPNSTVSDQTVNFGNMSFEDNITLTFNSRNGYGMSFTTAPVNGGNNASTITNNLQGGGLLSFNGNFWSNTDNGGNRTMTIGGNGDTLINGNIIASAAAFNHNLTKSGTGTLTITGAASTLDGNVNIQAGTIAISDWRAITNNTSTINIGNTTTGATLNIVGNNIAPANATTAKVINLSGTTGGATILANQTGTSSGLVFNADFTAGGAGAKTLTLGGASTAANTINGAIVNSSSATSLTKIDAGTWVLAGTNGYTGATTISNGILRLAANGTSSTVVNDASAITFNAVNVYAGGTLEFSGQNGVNNVETLGALTPTNGSGTILLSPGTAGTASLVFASLGAVGGGGSVNIVAPTANDTVSFTTAPVTGNIANAGLYYNGTNFAYVPGNGLAVRAPNYTTDADFITSSTALTASQSNEITGSFSNAAVTIDSLRIDGAQTLTMTGLLTVRTAGATNASGGILQTGGAAAIEGTGVSTGGSGALVIRVNSLTDSLTLNAPVTATTTGGLTKTGAGTLLLGATNAQTGATSINEGTVRLVTGGRLSANSATLTIRQGAILDLNGISTGSAIGQFNNNGTILNSSGTAATITVGGANGTGTSFGSIIDGNGVINVTKVGTGAQSWNNLSTYTGITTIGSTGIVTVNTLADGGVASGIGSSSSGAANLVFNGASSTQAYGGLSYAGTANVSTNRLFTFDGGANGGARIQANGANGATLTFTNPGALAFGAAATGNAQGLVLGGSSTGDNRFFPIISDNGAAATSVYKSDAGVWHLQATNTYTGVTQINGGALYVVDGVSLPTNSNVVLNGGSLAMTGNFTRTIGTGSGQFQWTATGAGGFSAGGSPLVVNFGSGNVWGSTPGFLGTGALLLNNSNVAKSDVTIAGGFEITPGIGTSLSLTTTAASSTVTLASGTTAGLAIGQTLSGNPNIPVGATIATITGTNTFTISTSTGVTAGTGVATSVAAGGYRQVNVGDFTSIGADFATISGGISGAGSLAKEGAGILNLRGANTYSGQTLVRAGTLVVTSLGNSATPGASSVGDSTLGNTDAGSLRLGNGGTGAGILEYVGPGETSDRKIQLNTTTGTTQIHADGLGALVLTNVANDLAPGAKILNLRGVTAYGNMITSQLSDNGGALGITVDGSAAWILTNGANNYTGTTTVSAGALGIGHNSALGTGILSLSNGSIFAYGGDRTIANPVQHANNTTVGFIGDYSLNFSNTLALQAAANNPSTFNNNIVAGKSLTFAGVTADLITANRTWTFDGSGETIINGNITTSTGFNLNLTKVGTGTLTLGGTASMINAGVLTVSNGTLKLAADNVLNNGLTTNLTMNPGTGLTATFDLNGRTDTIRGLVANSLGTAVINNSAAAAASLTVGAGDQDVTLIGRVDNTGTGALSLTKTGTGAATLSQGPFAHKGATNVNGGTLTFANDVTATTSLSVTGGSTLAINGGFSGSTGVNSLTVGGGSTLTLSLDNSGTPLSNLTSLALGTTGTGTVTLRLNIGDLTAPGDGLNSDTIRLLTGSTPSFGSNTITFNMSDAGLNPNQTYTLLNVVDGGLTAFGAANLIQGLTPGGFASYNWITTDNLVQLQVGNLVTGSMYWRGLSGTTWNGALNNWSTDSAGTIPVGTLPGAGTDVIFQWDAPSNAAVSTTLEQSFKVNSLTFAPNAVPANTATSVTIASGVDPTYRLQVAPQTATDGVKITAGGPAAVTISSPFKLGADQTWSVADATSTLTFAGALQGEQDVAVSGAGRIVLGAAADATFNTGASSDFTITGGSLELTNAGALGTSIAGNAANVALNGGAFWYNNATSGTVNNALTLAGGTLSAGGNAQTYSGNVNIAAASFVNMRDGNSAATNATARNITLSGALSGSGSLTIDSVDTTTGGNAESGTLTISNVANSWNGTLIMNRGTVVTTAPNGLGDGGIVFNQMGRIIVRSTNGNTYNLNNTMTFAAGAIGEFSVDNTSSVLAADFVINQNGQVNLGAGGVGGIARFGVADAASTLNVTGGVVLGGDGSISVEGGDADSFVTISGIISDGGSGYALAVNNDQGGWGATNTILRLSGLNTFSGNLTLSEGQLQFNTVTNAGGAASSLGQGSTLTIGAATLNFIGDTVSQSTNRAITQTGSATYLANGTNGASITYAGAISMAATSATLAGAGVGFLTGGFTQTAGGTNDLIVTGGDWTISTNNGNTADDLTVSGGTLTLQGMTLSVGDDTVVSNVGTVLNLNGAAVINGLSATSSGLYSRTGAVINFNANDAYSSTDGLDFILLGDSGGPQVGTLNMNAFNTTTPRLDLGNRAAGLEGQIDGTGTVTVTSDINFYRGTINANFAGAAAVEKYGPGTVTFRGDNSGLTSTTAVRIDEGLLVLDYTANNAAKLRTATGLDMRGGNLSILGSNTAATAQTVGSLTLGSGGSNRIAVAAGSGQEAVLTFGGITRAANAQDGTIRFVLPSGAQSATNGIVTSATNNVGTTAGILGGYATVDTGSGTFFARNDGSGNIVAAVTTLEDSVAAWVSGDNISDSTGFTGILQRANINSLRFNAATGSDLAVTSGGVLNIAGGGILVTDNVVGTPSISGGTLASGAIASNVPELIVTQEGAQVFEIASDIRVNHAVTKTGAGILRLSGNNVYTGYTEIQDGTLQVAGGNAIGNTSLVTLAANRDTTLQLLADETIGRLQGGNATTGSTYGTVALGSNTLTINESASTTFAGLFTGSGGIVLAAGSTGNFQLTNAGTGFSGSVVVNGGLFQIAGAVGRLDATSFTINNNGAFLVDNNDDTNTTTRLLDAATVTLNSANGTFSGETTVRGFATRNNDNDNAAETYGTLEINSGANYVTLQAGTGSSSQASLIAATGWTRANNATINVRGKALGQTSDPSGRSTFKVADANDAAMLAANVGGGAATGAGNKNVSIVPWAIGESLTGAPADANMGNTFLAYVDNRGFVPLDLSTEYATFATAGTQDNVRESLTADLTGIAGATINSLIVHDNGTADSTINVTGNGAGQALAVTSGALLFTLNTAATAASVHNVVLGGFDAGITVGSTNEYVFSVVNPSAAANTAVLTATVGSQLTSTADITKSGRGTLILTGANTAGGGANKTILNEGTLQIADLENIGGNGGGLVFAGGTLRLGAGFTDDLSQRTITYRNGGGTIDTNGINATFAASAGSGTGGLTKTGTGNLTLNAAATYAGNTTVLGGTLTVGANNATGGGTGDLFLGAGTTLDLGARSISHALVTTSGASPTIASVAGGTISASTGFFFNHTGNTTIDAVLAGNGGLLKAQTNVVTLSGLNTYTGTTEIQAGTLSFNSIGNVGGGASALGAPTTVDAGIIRTGLSTASAVLTYTGAGNTTDRIIALQGTAGGLTINNDGTGALGLGTIQTEIAGNKTLTLGGTSAAGLINTIASIQEVAGALSVSKTGASTWSLTGANNYTGATTAGGGVLRAGNSLAFGSSAVTLINDNAGLELADGVNLANALTVSNTGNNKNLQLQNGATSGTYSGAITIAETTAGNFDVVVDAGGTLTLSGGIGGAVAGGVSKEGAGTAILTNTNSYTGATAVNGGTLLVNGTLAASNVTVASGAVLGGNGTIGGGVTVQSGGHFAPGNSVAVMTVGTLDMTAGSIFDFEFNANPANDQIVVTGNNGLTLNGGGFNLYLEGTTNPFNVNGTYNLIQYAGSIGGAGLGSLSVLNGDLLHTYTFGTAGGYVTLTIDYSSGNFWAPAVGGGGGATSTWSASSATWAQTAGVQGTLSQGDGPLVFTDNAGTVTVSGTVATANGIMFSADGYTLTGGQINLTGANAAANALNVGSTFTTVIDSVLNAPNGLTKSGAGTLTLGGANVVANVVVNGGALNVTSAGSFTAGANLTIAASGTATLANSQTLGIVASDGVLNLNGTTTVIATLNGTAGSLNLGAGAELTVSDGTYSGNLTSFDATAELIKTSAGTLALNGTNSGFTGTTTINAGVLSVASALGGTVVVNGGSFTGAGAGGSNVTINAGGSQTVSGNQSGTTNVAGGTTDVGSGGQLSGTTNVTGGALNVQNGGLVSGSLVQSSGNVTVFSGGQTTGPLTINGGTFTVQSGGSASTAAGGGIDINAGGTFNLNAGGTLTGNGTVTVGGTFIANGTFSGAAVTTVENGGLLKGTGSLGQVNVQSGGTLSPGNSVGIQTETGLALYGGAVLEFEFGNVAGGSAGTGWDLIELNTGLLDLGDASAANPIVIKINALDVTGTVHDSGTGGNTFDPLASYKWLYIHSTNPTLPEFDFPPDDDITRRFVIEDDLPGAGVFDTGSGNAFTRPTSSLGQGTFRVAFGNFDNQGTGLYITYSAIPEPGSMILAGLASLGAGWYGRRRMKKNAAAPNDANDAPPTA